MNSFDVFVIKGFTVCKLAIWNSVLTGGFTFKLIQSMVPVINELITIISIKKEKKNFKIYYLISVSFMLIKAKIP